LAGLLVDPGTLVRKLDPLRTALWVFVAVGMAEFMLPWALGWFIVGIAASVVMRVRTSPHMWAFALICDAAMFVPAAVFALLLWGGDPMWFVFCVAFAIFAACDAGAAVAGCWLGAKISLGAKAVLRGCHARS